MPADRARALRFYAAAIVHDGQMPGRVDPPDLPDRAGAAYKAITASGRLRTLHFLFDNPNSTRPQISAGSGVPIGGVTAALSALEKLGYVTVDVEGPRNGVRVRYSADEESLMRDLELFLSWFKRS